MSIAARLTLAGTGVWTVALILGPLVRPDLDPITAHPEAYATGPWAPLMQAGYVGVALAGAGSAALAKRYRIPSALLVLFATGALVIGVLPPTGEEMLGDAVFPYAQLAPLALFPATAWISWRERRRGLLVPAVLLWLLFLPLVLGDPPGAGILNRAGDLAMAAWLAVFATSNTSATTARPPTASPHAGSA